MSLILRPVKPGDRAPLSALLDQPELRRRPLAGTFREFHPLNWSKTERTFVVEREGERLGALELVRDEPGSWELSTLIRADHYPGEGARSATAGLFYLFERLSVESVWFWVRRHQHRVPQIAKCFGFLHLHTLCMAGVEAEVYEMGRDRWMSHRLRIYSEQLHAPVQLLEGGSLWQGERQGFRLIKGEDLRAEGS